MPRRYDWASMNIMLPPPVGKRIYQAKVFGYPEHTVAKEHQYGAGYAPVGYVRDSYKITEIKLEILQGEADEIRSALGPGYMLVGFPTSLTFADTGLLARVDRFESCHITGETSSAVQGTEGNTTTFTIKPDKMVLGGIPPLPVAI